MASLSDYKVGPSLAVSDMERARAFYEKALGLRPASVAQELDSNRSYECGDGTSLNIYLSPAGAKPGENTALGFDVTEIEQLVAELTAQGVVFEQYDLPGLTTDELGIATFEGDNRVAYFKDPDGNVLSLAQAGDQA